MTHHVVYLGSDHRGFTMKVAAVAWLKKEGHHPHDLGPHSTERCDASDYALQVVTKLKQEPNAFGVLICGTGQMMAMLANRHKDIRAALCFNPTMARLAREHGDSNILVLGADIIEPSVAQECLAVFLGTQFLGGRYAERLQKLANLGGL